MCHSRSLNNKVNHIHERALRTYYEDFPSSFSFLLVKDSSFTIYQRNFQFLPLDIFKVETNISPEKMNEFFDFPKNFAYE